jgi:hypothetical protein
VAECGQQFCFSCLEFMKVPILVCCEQGQIEKNKNKNK